jgi:hypothetical protein
MPTQRQLLVAEFPENSLFASELAKLSAANQPLPQWYQAAKARHRASRSTKRKSADTREGIGVPEMAAL